MTAESEMKALIEAEHAAWMAASEADVIDGPLADAACAASAAIRAARPTAPAAMALQLRWIARELDEEGQCRYAVPVEHIAARLEALARAA